MEVADVLVAGERVGEGKILVDRVPVAPALACACDVAAAEQLGHDAVRRTLGDPNAFADVAQTRPGIACDADERARVVGQECPPGVVGHNYSLAYLE